jgi:E3 ubiquitin-protein ligase listerin
MSKRQFKSQASSSRATGSKAFGNASPARGGFGNAFGTAHSTLSYIQDLPDLSEISDPHLIVAFKNLSKKDSTTKAKALEDIQTYLSGLEGDLEEGVVEAWVGLHSLQTASNSSACYSRS